MIRPLRREHKLIWILLAILLPLVLAAGIFFRHSDPVNEKIPAAVEREKPAAGTGR